MNLLEFAKKHRAAKCIKLLTRYGDSTADMEAATPMEDSNTTAMDTTTPTFSFGEDVKVEHHPMEQGLPNMYTVIGPIANVAPPLDGHENHVSIASRVVRAHPLDDHPFGSLTRN